MAASLIAARSAVVQSAYTAVATSVGSMHVPQRSGHSARTVSPTMLLRHMFSWAKAYSSLQTAGSNCSLQFGGVVVVPVVVVVVVPVVVVELTVVVVVVVADVVVVVDIVVVMQAPQVTGQDFRTDSPRTSVCVQ